MSMDSLESLDLEHAVDQAPASVTDLVKRRVGALVLDAVETLGVIIHSARDDQAKTAACRQMIALARELGVLDSSELRGFLDGWHNDTRRAD
jgi:hypothetical protein